MTFEKSSYQSLNSLQTVCLKQNIPFVSYRLPLQKDITTFVQHLSIPEKLDSLIQSDTKTGFVIAPFLENDNHSTYLLNPDKIFHSDNIERQFIQTLENNSCFLSTEPAFEEEFQTSSSEDFIQQVNNAKKSIVEGAFHKVVLSKIRLGKLKADFDAGNFFLHLCEKYPHAFVYMIQLPRVGCWIGATPEPLLVISGENVRTVSLAGTQIATEAGINAYEWSQKEIEEQGIVTDFVEKTLQSLDIKDYSKIGPVNYRAANLIHLKTSFEFARTDLKNRLGDFLKALHPTPSVGGLPKKEAHDFILANEKHDRAYYTGFLGPINIDGETNLFVNLRCLQLFKKEFVLYSGAGITASSVAEREWEETDNKMMTMLNAINNL